MKLLRTNSLFGMEYGQQYAVPKIVKTAPFIF